MIMPSTKKELRRHWLRRREALDSAVVVARSLRICDHIQEHSLYRNAHRVLFTMPHRNEVDLRPLMKAAWREGKAVILPRTSVEERQLSLLQIMMMEELVPGAFGIMEPPDIPERVVSAEDVDLALVPGVAFDRCGYRLGYGGGYFDRFFAGPGKKMVTMGVAYAFQIVPTVYPEAHDIPLNGVITEEGMVKSISC